MILRETSSNAPAASERGPTKTLPWTSKSKQVVERGSLVGTQELEKACSLRKRGRT